MKILFIQISDIHCLESDYNNYLKFSKAVQAIGTLGKIDGAVLVVSGDLTESATKDQFRVCKKHLGAFLHDLGGALNCGAIKTAIVPGNHDIELPKTCRTAADIEKWDKSKHLDEELQKQQAFFGYANFKGCFRFDKICDVKTLDICGKKIQLCLLNSAPFSTREPDDKQFHFIPDFVRSTLNRQPGVDFKITIMHHHFEWCEWNTKEMLKQAISTDDLTFFGHDHLSETMTVKYGDGRFHNIIMGGRFNLDVTKEAAFDVVIYDTEQKTIQYVEYNWDVKDCLFVPKQQKPILQKSNCLRPSEAYISSLLRDKQNICDSIEDYYVFPKLIAEGETFSTEDTGKDIKIEDIFKAIKVNGIIHISGGPGAGKTSLLRFLYSKSADHGFLPIMIEQRDYRDSRIEKMLKDLFEEQYAMQSEHAYEAFLQTIEMKKVVFIDDFDLIESKKAQQKLLNSLLLSGWLVIYSTKERLSDIEEIVKEKLQCKEVGSLCILPVFKGTRDILIEKIGNIKRKDAESIEAIKLAFDYMVQSQTNLFSFTPANTLTFIKYFMDSWSGEKRITKTLSFVFETNLRTSMLKVCKKEVLANKYLLALEYIANQMYFELKTDRISIGQYSELISKYNDEKLAGVSEKDFMDTCLSASFLSQGANTLDLKFYDNNIYAYFVAKAISREFENDNTKLDKLLFVMKHICFGINDIIIMFLSFIRSNTKIVMMIADKAEELMGNSTEWSIEAKNLPFLQHTSGLPEKVPSRLEKENAKKQIEAVEKERHEMIRFKGIFDYSEEEVEKPQYIALRAFRYVQIVGRALVDQYGALQSGELVRMRDILFKIPQKIIYSELSPIQRHCDDLVRSLMQFISEKMPDKKITEEKIRELLGQAGTVMALNILNDIAYIVSNDSTMLVMRNGPVESINYRIMELMMEENAGNTGAFVEKAILLRSELEGNPYAVSLIAQIARKHIVYTGSIDHRQIDRLLSGKVLSPTSKGMLLLEKGKKNQK